MAEVLMYGVELESRCLTNVPADEDTVAFLVGTQNMKLVNQICKVHLDGSRIVAATYPHAAGEVRGLASDPHDASRLATTSSDYGKLTAAHSLNLYRMVDEDERLEEVQTVQLNAEGNSLEWEPEGNRLATLQNNRLVVYDAEKGLESAWEHPLGGGSAAVVRFSTHHQGNVIGVPVDRNLVMVDLRTKGEAGRIREAHSLRALFLDFNPNLQHVSASCGRDGFVRIWDWRQPDSALAAFPAHAHWANQLILSCGVDASLVLTSAQSVSSDANEEPEEEDDADGEEDVDASASTCGLPDGQLERIDEHDDSVYGCAWSTADPWTFASLSYDGRVLISHVNREHKYALMRL